MDNNWNKIWENRIINNIKKTNHSYFEFIDYLLSIDGFDSGTGKICSSAWVKFINQINSELDIKKNHSIFEVGCGAGAFLYPYYSAGNIVSGIDYSEKLVSHCNKIFQTNNFNVLEAINIESNPQFDFIFSFSVFFYFPDLEYASIVLDLMMAKAKNAIAILDVPDIDKREECESLRRMQYPPGEYEKKYEGLNHLYYSKNWFREQSKRLKGTSIYIFDQNIEGYLNSKFRFNCIIRK